jgi:hypothetical protein
MYVSVEGLSGVRPLRRRLFCGGCSRVEYQQIAAAGFLPAPSTDVLFLPCGGVSVLERCGRGMSGLVFGTLLGPEATGPGGFSRVLFVSGFLAAPITRLTPFLGVVCGVCGTGLLFENYIVDASIFYKKQFPRI